ncbi:MAG: sugar phosphate isomerase/epimerase family protein [Mucilaginibacter sp.]
MKTNRRTFIQQAGLLSAGLIMKPTFTPRFHKDVGLQLYTVREQIAKDVPGVLAKVAAAGYTNVEPNGYTRKDKFWGMDAKAFKVILDANNLTTTSGLYGVDIGGEKDFDDLKHFTEVANILGEKYVVIPWIFEEYRKTADDYKVLADKMNKAGEVTKAAGVHLGYHNHNFEFTDMGGGQLGYDLILSNTDPKLVKMEMDIYWIVRGGADPVSLFHKYPGRFSLFHVKDMDKANRLINTEVGSGTIDFKSIFANARLAGLDYAFVEQENFAMNWDASVTKSAEYLKNELLR